MPYLPSEELISHVSHCPFRYRQSSKRGKLVPPPTPQQVPTSASLTAAERRQLEDISRSAESRTALMNSATTCSELDEAETTLVAAYESFSPKSAPQPIVTPIVSQDRYVEEDTP